MSQNMVAQQQIGYLISQMEVYHSNHPQFLYSIKNSKEINNSGDIQAAAMIINVYKLLLLL